MKLEESINEIDTEKYDFELVRESHKDAYLLSQIASFTMIN